MKWFRRKKASEDADSGDVSNAEADAPNDGPAMAEFGLESLHSPETLLLGIVGAAAAFARSRWRKRNR